MKEIVNVIPYFISVMVTVIFYNLYFIKINNRKFKFNVINVGIIFLATILLYIANSYNNLWIKFVFVSIIFCAMLKLIYKENLKKVIVSYCYIYIGIILSEILFTNLLYRTGLLENYSELLSYTISKIILSTIVESFLYLIFSIRIVRSNIQKTIDFFANNLKIVNVLFLLCTASFIIGIINFDNFTLINSTKLIIILTMVYLLLFIIIIHSKTTEEILKQSNTKLIEYNDNYSKFLDDYKIYKHNINHKLRAIKSYGNKKVNALIDDLLNEENNFTIKNNNLYNVPNGIKGIVAEKLYNKNFSILINNKIAKDPFYNLSPKRFNSISECLGIALDNAIEASKETNNPIIILEFSETEKYISIIIGNNFKNFIDVERMGQKYYSTKIKGNGLGLFSIIRNNYVKEKISIINDFYYIKLNIKKAH